MPSCKPGWSYLQLSQELQAKQLGKHSKSRQICPLRRLSLWEAPLQGREIKT